VKKKREVRNNTRIVREKEKSCEKRDIFRWRASGGVGEGEDHVKAPTIPGS
jgi:hypothetical protein